MYELEVNHDRLSSDELPDEVTSQFLKHQENIEGVALLPWEEHCTECAMPLCYKTCDLYEARKDGKCRRFIGGIATIPKVSGIQNYIVRVSFKRWGQLMAYANLHMITAQRAARIERRLYLVDSIISRIPDHVVNIMGRRSPTTRLVRRLKQSIAGRGAFSTGGLVRPDYLLIETYNPNSFTVRLSLTVSNNDPQGYNAGYQQLLELKAGPNFYRIALDEISRRVDLEQKFAITLNPNILTRDDEGLSLYFGLVTLVWDKHYRAKHDSDESSNKIRHVKVVAWDLDNTLWDGILLEDGSDRLVLKSGIFEIIAELDRRGILNTVVSKNNHDDAVELLKKLGILEYFLYPKIGWEQKGQYLKTLIEEFNVGADTVAFIDDSAFERDEVQAINSKVRVYDAAGYANLLALPEFNPPVNSEAGSRRKFYQTERIRKDSYASFGGEYLSFLKDCNIRINLYRPNAANAERIQELVQRTNQLNFSGNRYDREEILNIISDSRYDAFCIDCEDRYGQYGTVGFAIVVRQDVTLKDLMLSCRVQSKRVEHAFLSFLLSFYKKQGCKVFFANFRKTERNFKAGAVFEDLKFVMVEEKGAVTRYRYNLEQDIPSDNVITVLMDGKACTDRT